MNANNSNYLDYNLDEIAILARKIYESLWGYYDDSTHFQEHKVAEIGDWLETQGNENVMELSWR